MFRGFRAKLLGGFGVMFVLLGLVGWIGWHATLNTAVAVTDLLNTEFTQLAQRSIGSGVAIVLAVVLVFFRSRDMRRVTGNINQATAHNLTATADTRKAAEHLTTRAGGLTRRVAQYKV